MYSYSQNRISNLIQQKSLIDQEIASLQGGGLSLMPTDYDFNGKYVNGYDEACKNMTNNKQIIMMDRQEPKFYMRGQDSQIHTYSFEEVKTVSEVDELKEKIESQEKIIEELKAKVGV